jgi:hypothetical protein
MAILCDYLKSPKFLKCVETCFCSVAFLVGVLIRQGKAVELVLLALYTTLFTDILLIKWQYDISYSASNLQKGETNMYSM